MGDQLSSKSKTEMKMIFFLLLSSSFSGVLSLKCYDGLGNIHGIPFENTTATCEPGVLNCYKITATDTDINEPINSWSCGVKLSRGGCVTGVPAGVTFDVGDVHYTGALTCFCTGDLCNSEHWCDTCKASGGVERPGFACHIMLALALVWMVFLLN